MPHPSFRKVARIIQPRAVSDGAGVRIKRLIGTPELDNLDPFLLFDHFGSDNPDEYMAGFPMHPHRGMETVTYMLRGRVSHRDSTGSSGTIGPGDVQWMTAGRGIMHEEMPQVGEVGMEGFQLWVNLPAKDKMKPPRYQDVPAESIAEFDMKGCGRIRLVAGEFGGHKGPVEDIAVKPLYMEVQLKPEAALEIPLPETHSAFAYLFEGRVGIGGLSPKKGDDDYKKELQAAVLATLGPGERVALQAGSEGARLLFVAGAPIGEPIARYGPFVMNTDEEIRKTLEELRAGTFAQR